MHPWLAYWGVVLVWATTPIGIASSNDSLHFLEAAGLRMLCASILLIIVCRVLNKPLFPHRGVIKNYLVASIGMFPVMALAYWGAQYVPTGIVSVMFAFNPVVIGLLSWLVLKDNPFTLVRAVAIGCSILGIAIIYLDQMNVSVVSGWGIVSLLGSVFGWSCSTIGLLKLNIKVDPLCQTAGASIFAVPSYFICWLLLDGTIPTDISVKSALGIAYLTVFGSAVGASLFFYVLANIPVMSVALITLIAPILALFIGTVFAGEQLSAQLMIGSIVVLMSLLLYQAAPLLKRLQQVKLINKKVGGPEVVKEVV